MPGVSGVTVVTVTAGVAVFSARRAAGALGARHSLRPLTGGPTFLANLARKTRGEIAELCLVVIASQRGAHSRRPLARNDGLGVVPASEPGPIITGANC